jgi:hypothetical protein
MTLPYTHPRWCDPRCCVVALDDDTCLVVEHRSAPMQFTPNADPENRLSVGLTRRDEHGSCPGKGELKLILTVVDGAEDGSAVTYSSTEAWLTLADARMFSAAIDHEVENAVAIGRLSPRVTS